MTLSSNQRTMLLDFRWEVGMQCLVLQDALLKPWGCQTVSALIRRDLVHAYPADAPRHYCLTSTGANMAIRLQREYIEHLEARLESCHG